MCSSFGTVDVIFSLGFQTLATTLTTKSNLTEIQFFLSTLNMIAHQGLAAIHELIYLPDFLYNS